MQNLTPDHETVARELAEREDENARELENLCNLLDTNETGKLSPEKFKEGMDKGRIPLLLNLLGLKRGHVLKVFDTMSAEVENEEGEVDIAAFVAACMGFKGDASNFDVQMIHAELQTMQTTHMNALQAIERKLNHIKHHE